MIVLVQGQPGAGKSFYAIRKAAATLEAGKPLVTNIDLAEDATRRIARRNPLRALSRSWTASRALELDRGLLVTQDLDEAFSVRLRGRGESRGVMVLDEAHQWMNARLWSQGDRMEVIRWFTQHRKLGWDVFLISQDVENIDRQVRSLGEYVVTLRNLRRAKWAGIPMSPVNLFLAVWRWHGPASSPSSSASGSSSTMRATSTTRSRRCTAWATRTTASTCRAAHDHKLPCLPRCRQIRRRRAPTSRPTGTSERSARRSRTSRPRRRSDRARRADRPPQRAGLAARGSARPRGRRPRDGPRTRDAGDVEDRGERSEPPCLS